MYFMTYCIHWSIYNYTYTDYNKVCYNNTSALDRI